MRIIDADRLKELFPDSGEGSWTYNITAQGYIDAQPTLDAILKDDNFGFAGYINEKNETGYHVGESWNMELDDEQMMVVMCGIIQDIKADERLSKLWMRAMDLADFMMEGETDVA